ncbi:MAG TPA: cytochrome c-type biogenesis protein CcmH [Candidatus Saccharimonadales bacterium]|nr:cytochrome c-type biogenesis protein CcmH [Candidatus Saccharimonadales bacterium]
MARTLARNKLHRWTLLLLFASTLLLVGASGDGTGQRFDRLGHNLMCECGCGQVLLECNHVGCSTSEQMRKELKLSMDRGDSDDVVLAGFVAKYGPAVLSAPTTTGFNRVAWIMPVVIFIAGLSAVVLVVRAWKRRPPNPPSDSTGSAPGELDEFRRRAREETTL